ncbi:histone-fold-containing protein [Aspergillus aurantiobrunneus]
MSSSPSGDADPPPKSHSEQPHPSTVQATEQQLKARAEGVSIEDYLLPRSITVRLAKSVLPPNTSVQKDAVLAIQKAATVFVSYLSSHANEATLKRTVSPADVLNAVSELEFEGFRPRLEKELDKFTDLKAAKRRPRKTAEGGEGQGGDGPGTGSRTVEGAEGEKKEVVVRGVKRVKRDDGAGDEEEDDQDQDQDQDGEDEGGGVGDGDDVEEEEHDEDATEEEEEDDEDEEDGGEGENIDRVEDLDRGARARRMVDPDAAGDETESEDERPGGQLRADLGLG